MDPVLISKIPNNPNAKDWQGAEHKLHVAFKAGGVFIGNTFF
jgi:hypothetical protein